MLTQRGFNLIELVITMGIAALTVIFVVPSFQNSIANNRIITVTNELVADLNLTRSEAIKRDTYVSLCASTDQQSCTGSDWTKGWIVFVDGGVAGAVDGMDVILHTYVSNTTDVNINLGGATFVRYGGTGFLAQATQPVQHWLTTLVELVLPGQLAYAAGVTPVSFSMQGQSIQICSVSHQANVGRAISIASSGRISSTIVSCN